MDKKDLLVEQPGVTLIDSAWWLADKRGHAPHEWLWPHITRMRNRQSTRYENFRKLINIFEWGYKAGDFAESEDVPLHDYIVAFNAAQNTIETKHAQLNATPITVMPITNGGGFLERQRAIKLQHALDGEFAETSTDEVQEDVTLDGFILSLGLSKVFREWGRVKHEHVPAEDIIVDSNEGRLRRPRNMYQKQYVDRFVLAHKYGVDAPDLYGDAENRRKKILSAGIGVIKGVPSTDSEMIEVWEAWHLPSKPVKGLLASSDEQADEEPGESENSENDGASDEETDGCHVICIEDCTLVCEPWTRNRFPFAVFRPRPRRRSWWGLSEMHALSAPQREYERVTQKLQQSHQRMGGTHILAHVSSCLTEQDLDNGQGTAIIWSGNVPPSEFNPTPANPQTYEYQASLPDNMMRMRGVSPTAAQSQVPAGLQQASGKALQVFEDSNDKRHVLEQRALERWKVDVARLIIEEARLLSEEDPSYTTRYRDQKSIVEVPWKEVLLDEDKFVLTIPPVSSLSKSPAGRFAQLSEMLNAGAITVEQFRRLYGLPDLEAENNIDTADTDIVDKNLETIVLEGRYLSPQPFDNLQLAFVRAGKFYNMCRVQSVPEDRLDMLQNFIADCQALMDKAKQDSMAQNPPPQGGPPGAPPPPPGPAAPPGAAPMAA